MSLGCSTRDIASAVSQLVKLVRALDGANGAASDYREAVVFLTSLKRTLEPLQTLSSLTLTSERREEIRETVERIKAPVEKFLAGTVRFESSLGTDAKARYHYQHVGKKLQWAFVAARKTDELKKSIEGHVMVLNNLLQRLTLEAVTSMQSNLSGDLKRVFTETLDPRLVSLLREQLAPMNLRLIESGSRSTQQQEAILSRIESQETHFERLQTTQAELKVSGWNLANQSEMLLSKMQEHEVNRSAAIDKIQQHITSAIEELKVNVPGSAQGDVSGRRHIVARRRKSPIERPLQTLQEASDDELLDRASLEEIYYLVLVYLGYFLRDLFHFLSRRVRPTPALMPKLLAKYHISFHDALGRPPRVLDYDCFVSYTVFKAFLEDSFSKTPGSSWVEQGLYKLADGKSNLAITPESWSQMIRPGSHVFMSMLIEEFFFTDTSCPTKWCKGTLKEKPNSFWKICTECGTEVITQNRDRNELDFQKQVVEALATLKLDEKNAKPSHSLSFNEVGESNVEVNTGKSSHSLLPENASKRWLPYDCETKFKRVERKQTSLQVGYFGLPCMEAVWKPSADSELNTKSSNTPTQMMNLYWIPDLNISKKGIILAVRPYTREGESGFLITTPGECLTDEQIDDICLKSKELWEKQALARAKKSYKQLKRPLHSPVVISRNTKPRTRTASKNRER